MQRLSGKPRSLPGAEAAGGGAQPLSDEVRRREERKRR